MACRFSLLTSSTRGQYRMRVFAPSRRVILWLMCAFLSAAVWGCSARASENGTAMPAAEAEPPADAVETSKGATIDIEPGGPADTVRTFYKHLRDGNVRAAIFLTNMRPAIEGLTDAELKEFSVDFERLAVQVPAEVKINGEIVSGNNATVTVEMPSEDGKAETQPIKLRREKSVWVMLSADEDGERRIRAEGKRYFHNLRIETHHEEAEAMLRRIAKAQLVYSSQNNGSFTDLETLMSEELVPGDVLSSASTGYNFRIDLSPEKKTFTASATPAEYGKSGKLSFMLDGNNIAKRDNGGKPLTR